MKKDKEKKAAAAKKKAANKKDAKGNYGWLLIC